MEIKQITGNGGGSFKAFEGNKEAGILDYTMEGPKRLVIEHTKVSPEFEGKGLGKKLVLETVEFARQKNLKIKPVCSYARTVFDRTEEIRDVLDNS